MPCPARERRSGDDDDDSKDDRRQDGPPPVLTKLETLSSIRVGSGSLALNDLKKTTNRGMTKVARTTTDDHRHDGDDGRVDQGRGDLDLGLDVTLDVVGQLVQHGVEVSGQLGRARMPT